MLYLFPTNKQQHRRTSLGDSQLSSRHSFSTMARKGAPRFFRCCLESSAYGKMTGRGNNITLGGEKRCVISMRSANSILYILSRMQRDDIFVHKSPRGGAACGSPLARQILLFSRKTEGSSFLLARDASFSTAKLCTIIVSIKATSHHHSQQWSE
jgi:hypothetical protein